MASDIILVPKRKLFPVKSEGNVSNVTNITQVGTTSQNISSATAFTSFNNLLNSIFASISALASLSSDKVTIINQNIHNAITSVSVSQPSRDLSVTYQNTSGKIMVVLVEVSPIVLNKTATTVNGYSMAGAYCSSVTPPTTVVAEVMTTISINNQTITGAYLGISTYQMLMFVVPPKYYYRIVPSTSGDGIEVNIMYWTEYVLF